MPSFKGILTAQYTLTALGVRTSVRPVGLVIRGGLRSGLGCRRLRRTRTGRRGSVSNAHLWPNGGSTAHCDRRSGRHRKPRAGRESVLRPFRQSSPRERADGDRPAAAGDCMPTGHRASLMSLLEGSGSGEAATAETARRKSARAACLASAPVTPRSDAVRTAAEIGLSLWDVEEGPSESRGVGAACMSAH